MSYGKIAALLEQMAGLRVSRSALCRALLRTAAKSQPIYEELVQAVRGSPVVYPDESGWRQGGRSAWLWVFTNRRETVYQIERGRGFAEAAKVLGKDYAGVLVVDGWAPYRRFAQATQQTCLAHLLRRCAELLETAKGGAAGFPAKSRRFCLPPWQCGTGARPERSELGECAWPRGAWRRVWLACWRSPHPRWESALCQASEAPPQRPVCLLGPGGYRGNQLAGRAGDSSCGRQPQVVRRKSYRPGCQGAGRFVSLLRTGQQHGLNLLSVVGAILRSPHPPSYDDLQKAH